MKDLIKTDYRVLRTRLLLLDSFSELLSKNKSIGKISIQSITDNAGINRVTFYDHFTDKYDLLVNWKKDVFRKALADKQLQSENAKDITYEQIIDTVLDFMSSYKNYFKAINKEYISIFEAALQEELSDIIWEMLKSKRHGATGMTQATAVFLSCAILGTANEWSINTIQASRSVMAGELMRLVNSVA
jgi:AcrR family transcriptional regulator